MVSIATCDTKSDGDIIPFRAAAGPPASGLPAVLPTFAGFAPVPFLGGPVSGLPALLPCGVQFLGDGMPSLSLMRFFAVPSLISPPEPAPSPSLPDPAPPVRERLLSGRGAEEEISVSFEGSTLRRMMEVLRCCGGRDAPASGAEDDGGRAGDMGLDGTGVDVPDG